MIGNLLIPNPDKLKAIETNRLMEMGAAIMNGTIEKDNWDAVDEVVVSVLGA